MCRGALRVLTNVTFAFKSREHMSFFVLPFIREKSLSKWLIKNLATSNTKPHSKWTNVVSKDFVGYNDTILISNADLKGADF